MNYGGDAADQIVRYSLDGVDHGLRLSGTLAKHLAVFVAAVLKDQKKTRGKTRMVRMLKENKPLKFFTVPSDRLREFCSEGRKRGLLYVIIRDGTTTRRQAEGLRASSETSQECEGRQGCLRQGHVGVL